MHTCAKINAGLFCLRVSAFPKRKPPNCIELLLDLSQRFLLQRAKGDFREYARDSGTSAAVRRQRQGRAFGFESRSRHKDEVSTARLETSRPICERTGEQSSCRARLGRRHSRLLRRAERARGSNRSGRGAPKRKGTGRRRYPRKASRSRHPPPPTPARAYQIDPRKRAEDRTRGCRSTRAGAILRQMTPLSDFPISYNVALRDGGGTEGPGRRGRGRGERGSPASNRPAVAKSRDDETAARFHPASRAPREILCTDALALSLSLSLSLSRAVVSIILRFLFRIHSVTGTLESSLMISSQEGSNRPGGVPPTMERR